MKDQAMKRKWRTSKSPPSAVHSLWERKSMMAGEKITHTADKTPTYQTTQHTQITMSAKAPHRQVCLCGRILWPVFTQFDHHPHHKTPSTFRLEFWNNRNSEGLRGYSLDCGVENCKGKGKRWLTCCEKKNNCMQECAVANGGTVALPQLSHRGYGVSKWMNVSPLLPPLQLHNLSARKKDLLLLRSYHMSSFRI